MGCPDAMDSFVNEKLSNIALPYTAENLPSVITGPKRAQSLEYQHHVLTSRAADLERGGLHQNINGDADQLFIPMRQLGRGGFGIVDEVVSRLSLQRFARKRIPRGRAFGSREQLRDFENRLLRRKRLSHRHLVNLVGSYTDKYYVGFLMTPVADTNLAAFLASTDADLVYRERALRNAFGCLAHTLKYIHENEIRHRDIKPTDILYHQQQWLFTDFGISYKFDDRQVTTLARHRQVTVSYSAPDCFNGMVCFREIYPNKNFLLMFLPASKLSK